MLDTAVPKLQERAAVSLSASREGSDIDGAIPIPAGSAGRGGRGCRTEMLHIVSEGVVSADVTAVQAVHRDLQLGQGVRSTM